MRARSTLGLTPINCERSGELFPKRVGNARRLR
jgi:hypothetical protein